MSHRWPNLQNLIDSEGTISVGSIAPIPCAAIANDQHNMFAALVQRPGETLTDLLDRLDDAVALAEDGDFTDEING